MDNTNFNLLWASLLVQELARHGITYYCFSSGSRVAPLAVAIGRDPATTTLVAFDERAAAFHALGYSRGKGQPAVLVCTTGSAPTHYFPAVVEAAQDEIPMLILTADLPPELRDCGTNQSIRQGNLYGDYVRWAVDLPCPDARISPSMLLTTVDTAVHRMRHPVPGPVHLNLAFRQPLSLAPEEIPASCFAALHPWLERTEPFTRFFTAAGGGLDDVQVQVLASAVSAAHRGLLIVGRLHNSADRDAALELANALRWPVFADILSGLRLDSRLETQVPYYDQLLLAGTFAAACKPDTVLQIGGPSVSSNLLRQLAAYPPREHIQLLPGCGRQDPNHHVSLRFQGDLQALCRQLATRVRGGQKTPWLGSLQAFAAEAEELYTSELDATDLLTEPALARLLVRRLNGDQALMLGNSLPVRDVDSFAEPCLEALPVTGNRGVSGIDGTVASAAGYAVGIGRPVTLLCGDLTLFHDLTSLYLLRQIEQPVTVVVINNGGGGSFSFLQIAEHSDVFETWFATPHALRFAAAAMLFGLAYHAPATRTELVTALQCCRQERRPALIEFVTESNATVAVQRRLQQELARRLGGDRSLASSSGRSALHEQIR